MNVFQLTAIHAESDCIRDDGSMPTFKRDLGVFTTEANAKDMMRLYSSSNGCDPWAYVLKERILDDLELHGHFNMVSAFRSVRSYFGDGTPNAENRCDDTGENLWHGRDAETIRFRNGDFVSVLHDNEIWPGLVGDCPMTKDLFASGRCGLEADDDCYLVYTVDGGHEHPFTPYVFPLIRELPVKVRAKLEAARNNDG